MYVKDNVQRAGLGPASPCLGLFHNNDQLAVHYPATY